jgi:hypothetical protein
VQRQILAYTDQHTQSVAARVYVLSHIPNIVFNAVFVDCEGGKFVRVGGTTVQVALVRPEPADEHWQAMASNLSNKDLRTKHKQHQIVAELAPCAHDSGISRGRHRELRPQHPASDPVHLQNFVIRNPQPVNGKCTEWYHPSQVNLYHSAPLKSA